MGVYFWVDKTSPSVGLDVFFSTKDLFLKHIFEHFIVPLLEAFKHGNLTLPSQVSF